MAELAYAVAGSILEKLGSVAYDEISLAWGMKKNLKKLKKKMKFLKSVLIDAEKKQARSESLRLWLVELKDVLEDAVDVLDEVECEAERRQVVKEYGNAGRKVRRFFSRCNPIVFHFSIAHKVKEIRERLDKITKEMARFQLISSLLNGHEEQSHFIDEGWRDRMTHSFVKASEVIGRERDTAHIIDMLLCQDDCNSDDSLSVIPIVGIGGLGKTTLAKSVYNNEKITAAFDLKIWVYVSLDFNVGEIVKQMLKATTDPQDDIRHWSIDQVQGSLRRKLEGKKFLLVLDDVWNEDRNKWLDLSQFLTVGEKGSKVIVTTRSTLVSSIMTKIPPHQLQGLSNEHSFSLFLKCAFGDEQLAGQYPGLKDIGKEIVRKCGGVPLALKTLGSLLYSKAEAEWIRVRDNEIWELERDTGRILTALRLSYTAMSPCLKQCFVYCSTFSEDQIMEGFDLISIWIALGILQSPNQELELEDIGLLQFKELCARSFLQYSNDDDDYDENYGLSYSCHMHDLIHDLACSITESECCIIKSGWKNISENVRHLRIFVNGNDFSLLKKFTKLRSIYFDFTAKAGKIDELFLSTCIAQSRYSRVFDLQNSSFEVLPSSIGTLKHLRFLSLYENKQIKRLPDSICKLQSLQTLILIGCTDLEELPRGIRSLVCLRTLEVTTKQVCFPENGVGHLKSLRTLMIGGCKNLRSLPCDLRNCTNLRTLLIADCEQLDLATGPNKAVIKLSLQSFLISELNETTSLPQWLKGAADTLKLLVVEKCNKLVRLPEWLPNLVSLHKIVIKECENLELASIDNEFVQLKLQTFKLEELPETTTLPQWLQGASDSLQILDIKDCPKLAALPDWLRYCKSLKKLAIDSCKELLTLPKGMEHLTSLTDLKIGDCKRLELASESIEVAQLSLQHFCIETLPATTSLPQWLKGAANTLQTLRIEYCPEFFALPEWLPDLTSLKEIEILRCPKLSLLPEGMSCLTSLAHLLIEEPSPAFYERYKPTIGEDWANIAHIPNISISPPW